MLRKNLTAFIILFFLLFANISYAVVVRPFIIDTDVGMDDMMALLLMLNEPSVEVKAILIDGNGNCLQAAAINNAIGLLSLVHKTQIPIAYGPAYSLAYGHSLPPYAVANSDMLSEYLPHLVNMKIPGDAAGLLINTLKAAPQPINILTIGSFTNIAQALVRDPSIKDHIAHIYTMGGAVAVPGNMFWAGGLYPNRLAEWNMAFDPLASAIVFQFNLPITIIPLDMTNHYPITQAFVDQFKNNDKPVAHYLYEEFQKHQKFYQNGLWYFWDPLAAYVAINPSAANCKVETLRVLLQPNTKSGALVRDPDGNLITVCYSLKSPALFKQDLLQHISAYS